MKFCAVVVVSSLLVGVLVLVLSGQSTTVTIENTKVLVKPTTDFILPVLGTTLLVVTLFSGAVVIFLTLLFSHRISGPIYRIQKEVEQLKAGSLDRDFTIRDKDQLQALAAGLADMADTLRDKHVSLNNEYHLLKQYLDERNFNVSSGDSDKLREILQQISATLAFFKV